MQQFLINIQDNFSFYYLNNRIYLTYKINCCCFYFYIPNNIKIEFIQHNEIRFFTLFKNVNILKLKISILDWINKFKNKTTKKLVLKGLGLKAQINSTNTILELKLGFSHMVLIKIPKKINIKLIKRRIILEGYNSANLGNFAFKIKSLKFPNVYKGKGIWYSREQLTLKTIKKS